MKGNQSYSGMSANGAAGAGTGRDHTSNHSIYMNDTNNQLNSYNPTQVTGVFEETPDILTAYPAYDDGMKQKSKIPPPSKQFSYNKKR